MSLIMTGAIVTASAYALFSAQATVSGIDFSTSTAGIEVSPDDTTYTSNFDANLSITNAFPGFGTANDQSASLWVRNTSSGIDLDLTAQLTAATGWDSNDLKNHVEVALVLPAVTPGDTEYLTLAEWNATPQALPGGPLGEGEDREYVAYVRLPVTAPDTLEGASLTDITFTITGTQVAP